MKWNLILFVGLSFISALSFADTPFSKCPLALPTDNPGFCPSFRSVAECFCVEQGLPRGMCTDMNALYKRIISTFGSLERACQFQHDSPTQVCIDDWNCFRLGGHDSQGRLCSSNGHAC